MKIRSKILVRIYLFYAITVVGAGLILYKAYSIQTYKDGFWVEKAKENNVRESKIAGERGNIFTFDGNLLATSTPYFDLYVDLGSEAMTHEVFRNNIDSLAFYMAQKFKRKSKDQYRKDLEKGRQNKSRYYPIQNRVDYASLKEIQQWPLFREGKYKGGLIIEPRPSRKNPYSSLAKRTIGEFRENAPLVGVEAAYNNFLAGKEGSILEQRVTGNTWMPIRGETSVQPEDGNDIITTIDINIQDVTHTALLSALDSSDAEFGCAIVMDVKTGAIRSISNLGKVKRGSKNYEEINNYAVTYSSEPGSTFKLVSYLMLLDQKGLKISDTIGVNQGRWRFYSRTMIDEHMHDKTLTIQEAFARSSNIAIARLIDKNYQNNKNSFYKNLEKYGLTTVSGIDLKGENNPYVPKPASWSKLSLPWKATGYEQKFTPLQILTFYNTVANRGYKAKPYLVETVVRNGKIIEEFKPQISKSPIASPTAIEEATKLLQAVIEHPRGTGRSIQSEHFELAGKTGTSKIPYDNKPGYSNENQATFAGFFPVDNPKYSCIVMIYKPKGLKRTGGSIAAPVFKEIAEKILAREMQIAPNYENDNTQVQYLAKISGENKEVKSILEKHGHTVNVADNIHYLSAEVRNSGIKLLPTKSTGLEIPNLVGMNLDDAIYILENLGLKVLHQGVGKVTQQSIAPGSKIQAGIPISLTLNPHAL